MVFGAIFDLPRTNTLKDVRVFASRLSEAGTLIIAALRAEARNILADRQDIITRKTHTKLDHRLDYAVRSLIGTFAKGIKQHRCAVSTASAFKFKIVKHQLCSGGGREGS